MQSCAHSPGNNISDALSRGRYLFKQDVVPSFETLSVSHQIGISGVSNPGTCYMGRQDATLDHTAVHNSKIPVRKAMVE